MENTQSKINQPLKLFNPSNYAIVGFLLSLFPVFLMSWLNSKVLPDGEKLRKKILVFFSVYCFVLVAYFVFLIWMASLLGKTSSISVDQIKSLTSLVNNARFVMLGLNLLQLIVFIKMTNVYELPTYQELKSKNLILSQSIIIPIIVSLIFLGIIFYVMFFVIESATKRPLYENNFYFDNRPIKTVEKTQRDEAMKNQIDLNSSICEKLLDLRTVGAACGIQNPSLYKNTGSGFVIGSGCYVAPAPFPPKGISFYQKDYPVVQLVPAFYTTLNQYENGDGKIYSGGKIPLEQHVKTDMIEFKYITVNHEANTEFVFSDPNETKTMALYSNVCTDSGLQNIAEKIFLNSNQKSL